MGELNSLFFQHVIVVSAALLNDQGQVLVQRRAQSSEHGGLWEFPGGKVEKGENAEAALVRELHEELGVHLEIHDLYPVSFSTTTTDGKHLLLLLYLATKWIGTVEAKWSDDLKWCLTEELETLQMPPADVPLIVPLERLVRMVLQGNAPLGRLSRLPD
jgi:8-oxo-dGTP diphosphatase